MSESTKKMQPVGGPVSGTVRVPGSKSITNRALVCAALAEGRSTLSGALESEDTRVMIAALGELGIAIATETAGEDDGRELVVEGCAGKVPSHAAELFVGNSGTTVRFLTAVATTGHGRFRLDGVERMRERPIADLLKALRQLGADVRSENDNGCPPVIVDARGLAGGRATIRGDVSSQFLSGLLLAAPAAEAKVELIVEGPLVSRPYVEMTLRVMEAFGVVANRPSADRFVVTPQSYRGTDYEIEPDASAASYFWAAAAITGGRVTVEGLTQQSMQGDVAFCDCLVQMGCRVEHDRRGITVVGGPLCGVDVDMAAISDTVQTLAAVALFAQGSTRIRGVGHIRHKETDRIGDLARELRKLGAAVDEHDDGLTIHPGALRGASIETYDDHRMAMSMALVGLRVSDVVIQDPGCTGKTYPHFFDDLASLIDQQRMQHPD